MTVLESSEVLIPRNTQAEVNLLLAKDIYGMAAPWEADLDAFHSQHSMLFYEFSRLNYCQVWRKPLYFPHIIILFMSTEQLQSRESFL